MAESKRTDPMESPAPPQESHPGREAHAPAETDGEITLALGPEIASGLCTVDGRFEVKTEIGRGGIGVAYIAIDKLDHDRPVVIKALLEQLDPTEKEWIERHFADEVKALARIDHHGVVKLVASGKMTDGRPFIAMELVEGHTLRSQIRSEVGLGDLERVAHIMRELGDAIFAAHEKGVYHRDLKPENIMLYRQQAEDKEVEHVKVIDFGISIVKERLDEKTRSTQLAGSIRYMAPEQFEGRASKSSDIYAMGLIAYEAITGRLPFNLDAASNYQAAHQLIEMQRGGIRVKPKDLRPSLPAAAQEVVLKALSFNPLERYQRADEFGGKLALALTQRHGSGCADQPGPDAPAALEMAHILVIDIVDYSTLPMDLQTKYLQQLQSAVRYTESFRKAESRDRLISLPTGEGIALAFFGDPIIAVTCAVELSRALKEHSHIAIRMGIHAGPVYRAPDINANTSLGGSGIKVAQKVTDCGEAGHILVSQSIADVLLQLSEWRGHLHDLGMHGVMRGVQLRLFNLLTDEAGNPKPPAPLLQTGELKTGSPDAGAKIETKHYRLIPGAIIAVLAAAVLVGVGLYLMRGKVTPGPAPTTAPAHSLKFWAQAQSYRGTQKEGDPVRLVGNETYFRKGDGIRFFFTSSDDCSLYLIYEDTKDKSYSLIFPSPAAPDSRVNADALVATSENVFDKESGAERVWIIWSARPIPELEEAIVRWANFEHQGKIRDAVQSASVKNLIEEGAKNNPDVSLDIASRQMVVKGSRERMIYLLELQHR